MKVLLLHLTSYLNCPDLLSVFVDAPERRTMPLGHVLAVVDGLVVELDDHFLGVVAILQYLTFQYPIFQYLIFLYLMHQGQNQTLVQFFKAFVSMLIAVSTLSFIFQSIVQFVINSSCDIL